MTLKQIGKCLKKHLLTVNLIKLNKLYEKITISLNVNHWIFFLTTFLTGCFRMQKWKFDRSRYPMPHWVIPITLISANALIQNPNNN